MSRLGHGYRLLLRCYPPAFRERFGAEMADTFESALASHTGWARRGRFLLLAIKDLIWSAYLERRVAVRSDTGGVRAAEGVLVQSIRQDLSHAVRSMSRRPGFLATVVVTLALGIGANTAIFSVIDAVLLHPLPIAHPEQVVAIHQAMNPRAPDGNLTYSGFRALQQRTNSFTGVAGFMTFAVGFRAGPYTDELTLGNVSGNYFDVLGVQAVAGRLFTPADDDTPHTHPVVVLSDGLWARAFNRNPFALGTIVYLGGNPFTVIGVARPDFRGTELATSPELWVPITMTTSVGSGALFSGPRADQVFTTLGFRWVSVIGRLRSGVTPAHATAELNAWYAQFRGSAGTPPPAGRLDFLRFGTAGVPNPMSVRAIAEAAAMGDRGNLVRFVGMLVAVVVLTLLLACANVANLLLIRAIERAHEFRVRTALGAARGRLVRQVLLESLVLALMGSTVGVVIGAAIMRLLSTFTLPGGIVLAHVGLGLNGRVLGFACVAAVVTTGLFGAVPALRASRVQGNELLGSHRGVARRSGSVLLAAQIAISLLLLVGAGLFARSVQNGLHTDLGFNPTSLVAVSTNLKLYGYDNARGEQYYEEAIARVNRIPGVTGVAVAMHVPLADMAMLPFDGILAPNTLADPTKTISAGMNAVSPDYFRILGLTVVEGRVLQASDNAIAPQVVVFNQSAARAFSPDGSPVGKTLSLFGGELFTIVGVVRDTKYESVRDHDIPVVFTAMAQQKPTGGMSLVVSSTTPRATLAALRPALRGIDPAVALLNPRLVANQIDETLLPQHLGTTLIGMFSLLALFVAAIGIYSIAMFGVAQRSREIGIRSALGAQRERIVWLVVRQVGGAAIAGLAIGSVMTLAAGRAIGRFLLDVAPTDPATFAGAIVVLVLATVLASWLPARRALTIDPAESMRAE